MRTILDTPDARLSVSGPDEHGNTLLHVGLGEPLRPGHVVRTIPLDRKQAHKLAHDLLACLGKAGR